jgi:O-antigen/teichoic acid export membrane protein
VGEAVTGAAVARSTAGSLLLFGALKARGLLVLPLYSRLFEPEALSVATLAVSVATLTSFTVQAGLAGGLLVELPHLAGREAVAAAYAATLRFVAACACAGILVLELLFWWQPPWPSWLSWLPAMGPHSLVIALLVMGYVLRDLTLVLPQLRRETRYLSTMNLSLDYGGSLLGLALVAAGYGPSGFLWGNAVVLLAGTTFSLRRSLATAGPATTLDTAFVRGALSVGLPLFVIGLAQMVIQSADRFLLTDHHGLGVNGIYSMAYSVATAVLAVGAASNLVFLPVAVNLLYNDKARLVRFVEESLRATLLILGLGIAGAFSLGPWALAFLAPKYASGAGLLPYMVVSYALLTLAQLLQWVPMVVARRATTVVACYGVMAVLNVALDVLLIPRWAMAGAVAAAIAAYGVGAVLLAVVAYRSLPDIRFRHLGPTAVFIMLAAGAAATLRLPLSAPASQGLAAVLRSLSAAGAWALAVLLAYVALGLAMGAIRRQDLQRALNALPSVSGRAAP